MRKYIPKAVFNYEGYNTAFSTEDKVLAAAIFQHLADTTEELVEAPRNKKAETFEIFSNDTMFSTLDKALAVIVFEYLDKNSVNHLKETVKRLKKELRDEA